MFDICIHHEVIITLSLGTTHPHTKLQEKLFACVENFEGLCSQFSNMQYNSIDHSHSAVLYNRMIIL